MFIEIVSSVIISIILFTFSKQITYVYNLEDNAREILSIILKLKAVQLPIHSIGYVPKNILKIDTKTNKIWITTVISSYIKQILYFAKDLIFNKILQRIVNIYYTHVASSFETNIYAIHCVCGTIIDTLCEIIEGYYSGLLVEYSNDIENKKKNLLEKVDSIEIYGIIFATLFIPIFTYPLWLALGKSVPWSECNPYVWLYSIEFIATVAGCNYRAYLSANKNTKAIRMMAFIGGICVRVPLCYIIYKYNIGLVGLSIVCGIDRIVRTIYLRLYIKAKQQTLFT